jgi:hypothetical protein
MVRFIIFLLTLCSRVSSLFSSFASSRIIRKDFSISSKNKVQSFDYTSMYLAINELQKNCIPSKVENIVQEEKFNIAIQIKNTLGNLLWIHLSWFINNILLVFLLNYFWSIIIFPPFIL